MTCDTCGQKFILIGDQVASPESNTWRRVICEHSDDKHGGKVPSVTVRFGSETHHWSTHE